MQQNATMYRARFGEPVPAHQAVVYAVSVETLDAQIEQVLAKHPGAPIIREKCEWTKLQEAQ